jgi:N-formylglutamate amidohydrolase
MKTLNFFLDRGIEVAINSPYSGTLVPMEHYKRNKNVQSIMIEVNRKLYLKDNSNVKSENYPAVKRLLQNYLDEIRKLL